MTRSVDSAFHPYLGSWSRDNLDVVHEGTHDRQPAPTTQGLCFTAPHSVVGDDDMNVGRCQAVRSPP